MLNKLWMKCAGFISPISGQACDISRTSLGAGGVAAYILADGPQFWAFEFEDHGTVWMDVTKTGVLAIGLVVAASGAHAEGLFASKTSNFDRQLSVIDGRATDQYRASINLQPERFIDTNTGTKTYTGKYRGPWLAVAKSKAQQHGIPSDLFLRLVQQESGWNPRAVSHAGATGLAQLMPGTARLLGVNINDPEQNLSGGARYLRMMYDKFGNWRLALAAYNAGPSAVEKYGGIPPYKETQNYVRIIYGG